MLFAEKPDGPMQSLIQLQTHKINLGQTCYLVTCTRTKVIVVISDDIHA
jgi:hypothetical protein